MSDHPHIEPVPRAMAVGVTARFFLFVIGLALVPLSVQGYDLFHSWKSLESQISIDYRERAKRLTDGIHGQLREGYNDLLTLSQTPILLDPSLGGKTGDGLSPIVEVFNRYVQATGDYYLIVLVDTDGRLIAVNDRDAQGNFISTEKLYGKNYLKSAWVQRLKAVEMERLSGNVGSQPPPASKPVLVGKVMVDPDVKEVFPHDPGLTVGFSTARYEGNVLVGFYNLRMKFSTIERLVQNSYQEMKTAGMAGAEINLQDGLGFSLIEYAPAIHHSETVLHDLDNVMLKMNWANSGFKPAQLAGKGLSGASSHFHPGKRSIQFVGYNPLPKDPAFPDLNWSVLIQVPEEQALSHLHRFRRNRILEMVLILGMVLVIGVVFRKMVPVRMGNITENMITLAGTEMPGKMPAPGMDECGEFGQGGYNPSDHLSGRSTKTFYSVNEKSFSCQEMFTADEETPFSEKVAPFFSDPLSKDKAEEGTHAPLALANASNSASDGINKAPCPKSGTSLDSTDQGREFVTPETPHPFGYAHPNEEDFSSFRRNMVGILERLIERTDRLALTMAVETVSAGDQGRGLSIAAREIRTLAARTQKASKEIVSIVKGVQSEDCWGPAGVGKDGKHVAYSGVMVAREAAIRLGEIVNGILRVLDLIQPMVGIFPHGWGHETGLRTLRRSHPRTVRTGEAIGQGIGRSELPARVH